MTTLEEQIAANLLEAQRLTRKFFVVELNLSDASVNELELQIDAVEYSLKGGKSEENIQHLKRLWGTYLGEVIRRKHGGEWVEVADDSGTKQLVLHCSIGDLYPCEQVQKRLTGNSGDSLTQYLKEVKARFPS